MDRLSPFNCFEKNPQKKKKIFKPKHPILCCDTVFEESNVKVMKL